MTAFEYWVSLAQRASRLLLSLSTVTFVMNIPYLSDVKMKKSFPFGPK